MDKKLTTRAELSRMAGVSAAAVTKACNAALKPAVVGKRVDLTHPAAIKYLQKKVNLTVPIGENGIDELYDEAVALCRAAGKCNMMFIHKELGVSQKRAASLSKLLRAAQLPFNKKTRIPATQLAKTKKPKPAPIKGHTKVKQDKKSIALQALAAKVEPPAPQEKEPETETGSIIHEVPDDIQAFADMTLRELIERFGSDVAFCDWLKAVKSIEDINEKRLKNAATRGDLVSRKLIKQGIIDPVNGAHTRLLTDVKKTLSIRVVAMAAAGADQDKIEEFIADQITSVLRPIKKKVAVTLAAI